ncbi:MAG: hypothetical protein GY856_31135 [bacterium]|nr:hypothetical protein [bacterium]
MQIVYISNRPEISAETLEHVAGWMPLITSAIFVCPAPLAAKFQFDCRLQVTVIAEDRLLGERLPRFRRTTDHQAKNWLLRASLAHAAEIDPEFIMSDDDSRPLSEIPPEFFKESGKYHSYYFYHLASWRPRASDYDRGQHSTRRLLAREGLPTLSYSSHMPQIINRRILGEVGEWLDQRPAPGTAVDEWSLYFNYAQREYPELFHPPRPFTTLCWPALPTDWEYDVRPPAFQFENFYPGLYEPDEIFGDLASGFSPREQGSTTRLKIERRRELQRIYDSRPARLRRKAAWLAHRALVRCRDAADRAPRLNRWLTLLLPAALRRLAREVVLHGDDPAWSFPRRRRKNPVPR